MNQTILLCDDEMHILRAAEFKFRRAGFDVHCASDGQEAWEIIQRETPDLLISDYQMPRMDGLQLIRTIREDSSLADLPIILLTAKGFELNHNEITQQLNVLRIVSKPFSPRELLKIAQETLAGETVA